MQVSSNVEQLSVKEEENFTIHLSLHDACLSDSTEVWSCNTLKKKFFENLYFLVTNVLMYQNLVCGTLICPLSIWQLG